MKEITVEAENENMYCTSPKLSQIKFFFAGSLLFWLHLRKSGNFFSAKIFVILLSGVQKQITTVTKHTN